MDVLEQPLGTISVKIEYEDNPDEKIQTFSDVRNRYEHHGSNPKEHLYAVFLKGGNQLVGDKLLGLGTNDAVNFDTHDIARTAILANAKAVILVHNHPSGNPAPTEQDIETTRDIHELLQLHDIDLLDHVIIADADAHSMRQHHNGPF